MIYALADGDILKIDSVTCILLDEAFTFLSYQIDLKLQESIKLDANNQRH